MSGTLFVVATPIGNLEDITLRALRVLREVNLIAAEDTRRTARLLTRHGIATPSLSFHQHNLRTRLPQLLSRLRNGATVALVTDAGTPGISDPGAELVAACIEARVPIDTVPGVSAPLAAAVVSGFPLIPLTIFGFPPRRSKDRTMWLDEILAIRHTMTFFESPHRITATMQELGAVLGDRPIMLARELTKQHQEFVRGTAKSIVDQLRQVKGEMTVVVGPENKPDLSLGQIVEPSGELVAAAFYQLTEAGGLSRRSAVTEVARRFNLSTRLAYATIERSKRSGK